MLADVRQRLRNQFVRNRCRVRRNTHRNTHWTAPQIWVLWLLAINHPLQQLRRTITDHLCVSINARHRWIRKLTNQLVVVHTDDRHLFRHVDLIRSQHIQNLTATNIITSHQTNRLGKIHQPRQQLFFNSHPIGFNRRRNDRSRDTDRRLRRIKRSLRSRLIRIELYVRSLAALF